MRVIKQKNIRKYLVAFLVILCVLAGFILQIAGKISKQIGNSGFPEGDVQELVLSAPDLAVFELPICLECPTYPYEIQVPEGTEIKEGLICGSVDGIAFRIMETDLSLDNVMGDLLPRVVNQPVLGYVPKYEKVLHKEGYLYDKKAAYQAGIVETKISVRKLTAYTCAYMLYLEKGKQLVFYASVEEEALFKNAEILIRQMAVSTQYGKSQSGQVPPGNEENAEKGVNVSFSLDVQNDFFLDDGICVLHWTNVTVKPKHLVFKAEEIEIAAMEESVSVPGEYIFRIGNCKPGTYQLVGEAEEPLYNVWVNFQEWKDYIGYMKSEEDPEFLIPKDPD